MFCLIHVLKCWEKYYFLDYLAKYVNIMIAVTQWVAARCKMSQSWNQDGCFLSNSGKSFLSLAHVGLPTSLSETISIYPTWFHVLLSFSSKRSIGSLKNPFFVTKGHSEQFKALLENFFSRGEVLRRNLYPQPRMFTFLASQKVFFWWKIFRGKGLRPGLEKRLFIIF